MRFTLVYDGRLRSNGDTKHKHDIRRVLHRQLVEFWKAAPPALTPPGDPLRSTVGAWSFFPLASAQRDETVELSITMLRPGQAPGYLIGQGGDIDNRLKTLFDSLRVPQCLAELPAGAAPTADENPLFCVLSDDRLVASLSVVAERLLEVPPTPDFVKLLIDVRITKNARIGANMIGRAG
jgi:hypothetical protein